MLCQSKLFQYLLEVGGRRGGGSRKLEVQITEDHYLCVVQRNVGCRAADRLCDRMVYDHI